MAARQSRCGTNGVDFRADDRIEKFTAGRDRIRVIHDGAAPDIGMYAHHERKSEGGNR